MELPFFIIVFVLMLPLAYSAWFTPDDYLRTMHGRRKRLRKRVPWHPETWTYGFYERYPNFDIFMARAGYLFFLVVFGVAIVVVIANHGPF